MIPRAVLRTYEPEPDQWDEPEAAYEPGESEMNRDAAPFDPPGVDSGPHDPEHFQMHEGGLWERGPSADDGYSGWVKEQQEMEAGDGRPRPPCSKVNIYGQRLFGSAITYSHRL